MCIIPGYVQINISDFLSQFKTLLDSLFSTLVAHHATGDLAGVEDLGAVDARLGDCLGALRFVLVVLGAVDLPVVRYWIVAVVVVIVVLGLHGGSRFRALWQLLSP